MQYRENNRQADARIEREIARFMDDKLYSQPMFADVKRTDSKREQINGSDIRFSIPSLGIENIVVDEKCASHYCDGRLNTFTLELSFVNKWGNITDGWLINRDNSTEYYMLMWLTTPYSKNEWNRVNYDSIEKIEYALVSKKSILSYLERNGVDKQELRDKCEAIREYGEDLDCDIDGVEYTYSTQFVEQPINIKINKRVYKKIAIISGVITK